MRVDYDKDQLAYALANALKERDEANQELSKKYVEYGQLFDEAEKIRIERDGAREALMKIEDLFIDGTDIYADRENMGLIARNALEGKK